MLATDGMVVDASREVGTQPGGGSQGARLQALPAAEPATVRRRTHGDSDRFTITVLAAIQGRGHGGSGIGGGRGGHALAAGDPMVRIDGPERDGVHMVTGAAGALADGDTGLCERA